MPHGKTWAAICAADGTFGTYTVRKVAQNKIGLWYIEYFHPTSGWETWPLSRRTATVIYKLHPDEWVRSAYDAYGGVTQAVFANAYDWWHAHEDALKTLGEPSKVLSDTCRFNMESAGRIDPSPAVVAAASCGDPNPYQLQRQQELQSALQRTTREWPYCCIHNTSLGLTWRGDAAYWHCEGCHG